MAQRIQLRRGTAAEWTAANPVLALGEPGVEKPGGKLKLGDGVTAWNDLPYASKGDKGDQGAPGIADDASVAAQVTGGAQTVAALSATIDTKVVGKVDKLTELHVFVCAGQSNMSGRGLPFQGSYDPNDYRIFQYGAKVRTFRQATVPLDMLDVPTGISVATTFAREYLRSQPPGVGVLLVPAAMGATGLVRTDASGGTWDPAYAGVNPRLYSLMLTQTSEALAAAAAATNLTPILKGILWHQGEHDSTYSGMTQAAYAAKLDALITGARTALGSANLPFVIGGMVPEELESVAYGTLVRAAQVDTRTRIPYTGYAEGVRNGGGSGSATDRVHYHRSGVERLGALMVEAYRRALNNVNTTVPVPPLDVEASFRSGKLTVRWAQPMCRVTDFLVQYSIDGGSWTTMTGRPVAADPQGSVTGLTGTSVQVRVATVNENGTSAFSTRATAGAGEIPVVPMAPDAVTLTTTGSTGSTVDLAWTASPTANLYKIMRRSATDGVTFSSWAQMTSRTPPTLTLTPTTLTAGTTYQFKIVASNPAGDAVDSNVVSYTAAGAPGAVPAAPTNLTLTGLTGTSVRLAWDLVTDSTVDSLVLQRRDSVGTSTTNFNAWFTDVTRTKDVVTVDRAGLIATKTYQYQLIAHNPNGNSVPSNVVQFTAS